MSSGCEDVRMSLGAHMLGALDADEAARVETHMETCPECRAEFEELSGLSALLSRVSEEDVEQVASPPTAVLDRLIAASARRRRVNRLLMGLAATVGAIVVGGAAWMFVQDGTGARTNTAATAPAAGLASAEGVSPQFNKDAPGSSGGNDLVAPSPGPSDAASDPSRIMLAPVPLIARNNGVEARITPVQSGGGTALDISISGVTRGTSCRVIAVALDGAESPAGSWTIDAADYPRGGTATATFTAHTELSMDRIKRFEFRTETGRVLVSVPNNH
ncbi:zf-HC2 domain-containing protein [Sphaerisporangium sp. NPDC051017]|uniref:anti-sigma factor family protein n=1 Tax=Sphaerisporangium sp. NPDC051017 TaxID=3154636 RepID=UPI00344A2711